MASQEGRRLMEGSLVKNAIFWDVTQCGSCKNRRFGGTYRLHHQGDKNRPTRNNVSSNVKALCFKPEVRRFKTR
jgi:hypothetical protein